VETPGSCIVTPYMIFAAIMVRLACVMMMNCVSSDISRISRIRQVIFRARAG